MDHGFGLLFLLFLWICASSKSRPTSIGSLVVQNPLPVQFNCDYVDTYVDAIDRYTQTVQESTDVLIPLARRYNEAANLSESSSERASSSGTIEQFVGLREQPFKRDVGTTECDDEFSEFFDHFTKLLKAPRKSCDIVFATEIYRQTVREYTETAVRVLCELWGQVGDSSSKNMASSMLRYEAGLTHVNATNAAIVAQMNKFTANRNGLDKVCAESGLMSGLELAGQLGTYYGSIQELARLAEPFAAGINATRMLDIRRYQRSSTVV